MVAAIGVDAAPPPPPLPAWDSLKPGEVLPAQAQPPEAVPIQVTLPEPLPPELSPSSPLKLLAEPRPESRLELLSELPLLEALPQQTPPEFAGDIVSATISEGLPIEPEKISPAIASADPAAKAVASDAAKAIALEAGEIIASVANEDENVASEADEKATLDIAPEQPPESQQPEQMPLSQALHLRQIEVLGSSIFAADELQTIIDSFQNRPLAADELRLLSDQITQLYLNRGYITSRALVPQIEGDRATVQVVEGQLERIEISGTQRVSQDYIRRRIALAEGPPLNTNTLEAQLKLLRSDPLFDEFTANLKAGSGLGQSILTVQVREANPTSVQLGTDNHLPPSVGSEQATVQLQHLNLTGNGDRLSGSYGLSRTVGSQQYGLRYSTPINPKNGRVTASAQITRSRITQDDFESFDIRGSSQRYSLNYRQPVIRKPNQELALSAGFTHQTGQTFLFEDQPTPFGLGPDEDGISRTSVFNLGQDYIKRQASGAWVLQSQLKLGTGLLNATQNQGSVPDGQFISWSAQVQRVQRVGKRHLFLAKGSLQLTPHSLLPSQQMSLGGGQSIRGYRQNARSGDNGFRVSLEDRITLQRNGEGASTLQLVPFAEVGKVWNVADNPNRLSNPSLLASAGVGVIWQPQPEMTLRLDYGVPLITIDRQGNSLQEQGLHFSANYRF